VADVQLRKLLQRRPHCLVYKGVFRKLGTDLNVEIFPEPLEADAEQWVHDRMRRAAATREIRSPRVVALTDLGRTKEFYYIVSEHQPRDLRQALDGSGKLRPRRVLSIADDVLNGLKAVHEAGMTHGNVSPEGILLGHDDSARLCHLGTQRPPELVGKFTVSPGGSLCGRALYAAPEVPPEGSEEEDDWDIRADIYSLGVTMFEMLVGRPPYTGEDAQAVREQHLHSAAPDPAEHAAGVPPELGALVQRLMAREPDDRPETPAEALEEVRECAMELSRKKRIRPVKSALTGAQRWMRRLTWGGLWSLVAVLLVLASVVPMVMLVRGCREREEAEVLAREDPRHRMLVLVTPGRGAVVELPPEEHYGVRTMLSMALEQQPEVEPWDRSWTMQEDEEQPPVEQILQETQAPYVMLARYTPGMGRRRWLVACRRQGEKRWYVQEAAIEEGAPDGLAALEKAAHEVLNKLAERIPDQPEFDTPEPVPASAEAWAAMGRALQRERLGDWDAALEHTAKAREAAPDAAAFAVFEAYYRLCRALEEGEAPPAQELPEQIGDSQWGLLARALDAAVHAPDEFEARVGRLLLRYPYSLRGYYLMGLWRWRRLEQDGPAVLPLEKALALDEAYEPARRAYKQVEYAAPDRPEGDPTGGTGPLKMLREAAERMEGNKAEEGDE
jgi:tetratricopeptide (TPR) repeat protein